MKLRLPSIQPLLLHSYSDNLIYRHEIRMNWKGKLVAGSPVLRIHLLMLPTLAASGVSWLVAKWAGVAVVAMATYAVMALLTHFYAFLVGYRSIERERISGTLDQLYLTLLNDQDMFEGKFYAHLDAISEARRYLIVHGVLLVGSLAWLSRAAELPVLATGCLMLIFNHIMFSAQMGLLGGLSAAAHRRGVLPAVFFDSEHNPLLPQVIVMFRGTFRLLFVLLLTGGVAVFIDQAWVFFLSLIFLPLDMATGLRDIEVKRREAVMRRFRRKLVSE